jgi:hypothetical protein
VDSELVQNLDADSQYSLRNIRAATICIWSRPLHRYYTDHTVAHSERVIALLDGLTAGMMATDRRLCTTEVFVLLAAAYLHDVGMQNERYAGGDLEEIRAIHHELSAEMIYGAVEDPTQALKLGLPDDPGLVEAIALVSKGHRKVDLQGTEYERLIQGGETVRMRLLAALLRFADELDIDYRRVDLEQIKLMNLPLDSQLHWWKCHYVSGVSIVDEFIHIVYRFPASRPDYENLIVLLVETDIRAKLAQLEETFRADAVKVALGKSQVRQMRLLQPLSSEVEALAWEQLGQVSGETAQPGPAVASADASGARSQLSSLPASVPSPSPGGEMEQRRADLEQSIRESYGIIREYEAIVRTSDRPEEKVRARRIIQE